MNQIARCDWLPELGTTHCIPLANFSQKPCNKSFIDQVCSVKMAGYWPRSFFARLWTSTSPRSINTQKKNLANIQPSWPHTWSITHTCYSFKIFLRFWLVKTARIIHHNQLLLTKYWTNDIKSAARWKLLNRWRICKPLACGSWFTNSSRVLPTSGVVYQLINHRNVWSIS